MQIDPSPLQFPAMNVVLMGYRASGKSTIGRRLARELGLAFVDVDDYVCERMGQPTIRAIWEVAGEQAFRDMESQAVCDLMAGDGRVVALGGGSVMNETARRAIMTASEALRIYLHCHPEELFRRVQADRKFSEQRPNRAPLGGGVEQIAAMLATREPVYRALADHGYDVTAVSIEQIVDDLVRLCRGEHREPGG